MSRTTERKLESFWRRTARRARYPALDGDASVEVAVVGAGITGLTAALLLARAGRRVAILEADRVGGGTSGATSAHVTEVSDAPYTQLIEKFGEDGARAFAGAYRQGAHWIATEARGLRCDYRETPAYHYAEAAADVAALEEDAAAARRLGVRAEPVRDVPLPFAVAGGVRYPGQAQFQPVRYLSGLARRFRQAGGEIFERTRVVVWEELEGSVSVATERGTVAARQLVLATHTPPNVNLVQSELGPYRSYLVLARLRNGVPHGLFWDSEDPYHYIRAVPHGDGELLLVGGEDHKSGQEEDTAERYAALERYTRDRFAVAAVEARWSAQLFEPADGAPYIGRSPFSEQVYLGTGYSGVGLVGGTVAGLLLSDLLLARSNPWAELFDSTRIKPIAAAGRIAAENLDAAAWFVRDRVSGGAVSSADDVPRSAGRLVETDGEKLAVYRDPQGELHALSPYCTHLGCIVHWNEAEESWDCPCHGGRYTPDGAVLSGPPTAPLEERTIPEPAAIRS